MAMLRDEELCRQMQEGNEAALEALVHRHHQALFAYLYRLAGDAHAADDLTQEAFIRVCHRIQTYRYPEAFRPWLFTIATNLYKDWRKSAYQQRVVAKEPPDLPAPVDLLERTAQRSEVIQAVNGLDEAHRVVLFLRYYHDLTVDEIARIVGIPEGTVKSRLSVGIRRLREHLLAERRAEHAAE